MPHILVAPRWRPLVAVCLLSSCPVLVQAEALQQAPVRLPEMSVTTTPVGLSNPHVTGPASVPADSAELLRRMPGAQVNRNGALTGIAQYRGLFGPRLHVSVDQMPITSGGPNWMDPPLHYAPGPLLERLELRRGIAPVSVAGESLGGALHARLIRPDYTRTRTGRFTGLVQVGGRTADQARQVAALAGWAASERRLHAAMSAERGKNLKFPGGEVRPTEHARAFFAVGLGQRWGAHEIMLDLRHNDTGHAGTPALPMDIRVVDSNLGRLGYQGQLAELPVEAWFSASGVEHGMSNYHLRPAMDPNQRRHAVARSRAQAWGVRTELPLAAGQLSLGLDADQAWHETDIHDPDNARFFVRNFNAIQHDRYGGFGQWQGALGKGLEMRAGIRFHHSVSDAGEVDGTPARMMPGPAALRDRFNAADRRQVDNNLDWTLQFSQALNPRWRLEMGVARKTRAPAYQERYLWLPMESTAGLADGNRYVGRIDLGSEVSHQLELGLEWRGPQAWFAPRVFWREVDDYIQGVPASDMNVIMVSSNHGDSTPLAFANVDARLFGADIDLGARWGDADRWQVQAILNLVRGERRDIDDNLYRVAPPNAWLMLEHQRARWSLGVDVALMASQSRISATNEEQATSGYALLHLRANRELLPGLELQTGVENVLDRRYQEHLNGYNRVMGSDVAVGHRLPGGGRSFQASLRYHW